MKWDTEYYGMVISAENEEEKEFLSRWYTEMKERLPEESKSLYGYDGDDQFGMQYDAEGTEGYGTVWFMR